ncbi:MAG: ATP-binding protein [Bacteroidales bacterium]|nr:ATP-binding protein [Bacteroidales bacterium]
MSKSLVTNPFIVGKYVSPEYFCDREQETDFLIKQIYNGRNLALISPRRMGKTGLIEHCFGREEMKKNYYLFFIDIYSTSSLAEMVYLLGKTIYEELKPRKSVLFEKFINIVASLRMGFKLDILTGEPTFDIGLGDISAPETTLDEIFEYLESADKPCVVAIDEFQQISGYPEKNIEALLRSKIQKCRQTQFIFCGSKRHMMGNMFQSPSKPFYQSAITIGLKPINMDTYLEFAISKFQDYGKMIDQELVKKVYSRLEGCTWFVQMIMNELFALTPAGEKCGLGMFDVAWENVIMSQDMSYREQFSILAPKQKLALLAIAKECIATNITSAEFIKKHNLSSASSLQSALKPLLNNDTIVKEDGRYRVYDYFYAEWLKKY